MTPFLQALSFLLQDLAATLVFAVLFAATGNTVLAALAGTAVGLAQIAFQLLRGRPVQSLEWLSLVVVLAAAAGTLLTDDPRFILAKPTVVYAAIGVVMLKRGWLLRYLPAIARRVAPDIAIAVGYAWSGLMFVSAAVNGAVALAFNVPTWALVMPAFGFASKAILFLAGFGALRLTVRRRLRAMPAADREALLKDAR
ncbi:septation protein IspZ [uncultured Alsobacter sp.]|uniref:septation protein IspZ n=1 Tax=uncultured Alsobacter sp. TaxID=1748258 RepID=UPI0025FC6CF7|nr:septation protein IspZ [uncultured Alsobacter sp.]